MTQRTVRADYEPNRELRRRLLSSGTPAFGLHHGAAVSAQADNPGR